MKNNCDVVWFVVLMCVLENLSVVKADHCLEGDLMCRISDQTGESSFAILEDFGKNVEEISQLGCGELSL